MKTQTIKKVVKKKATTKSVKKSATPIKVNEKKLAKVKKETVKKVIKVSDPRTVELQKKQKALDYEAKLLQNKIKVEKKAIADAEKKVALALKSLTSNLATIKKAVSAFGTSVVKAENDDDIVKANVNLRNVLQNYDDQIDNVNQMKENVLTLINGEVEENLDDL